MGVVDIKITITDNTAEITAAKAAALDKACETIGQLCESSIKMRTPVGTPESTGIRGYHGGTLRNSITHAVTHEGQKHKVVVGTNIEYAPYVELGTGKYATNGNGRKTPWVWKDRNGEEHWTAGMKPRHFIKNGIEDNKESFKPIIENALKGQ